MAKKSNEVMLCFLINSVDLLLKIPLINEKVQLLIQFFTVINLLENKCLLSSSF